MVLAPPPSRPRTTPLVGVVIPKADPLDRLMDALTRMVDALAGMGIRSPAAIVLQTEDDKARLAYEIDRHYRDSLRWLREDGKPRPFTIMGIEIEVRP